MVDMNYWLDRQYALLQQQAGQGQKPGANVTAGVPADGVLPGKVSDPFAGIKAGDSRTVGNWTGRNVGGVTVVANSKPNTAGAIDNYLTRGFSLKDATAAALGSAAGNLDVVRGNLLPEQTAADIAQSRAQTGLLGAQTNLTSQQARTVVPESQARIRGIDADTGLTSANTGIARRRLKEFSVDTSVLDAILAGGYRLGQ